jgi:hypothetical protein
MYSSYFLRKTQLHFAHEESLLNSYYQEELSAAFCVICSWEESESDWSMQKRRGAAQEDVWEDQ